MKIAVSYTMFALIATLANICAQEVVIRCYKGPFNIVFSVMIGTIMGLLVKYILDKRYIFRFEPRDANHAGQTFALYSLAGLATTGIFWGFEFGFQYIFETKEMRYLGGVIGLAIGYLMKYQLDKRYVFRMEVP
jgi:putative flippase GtrA